MSGILSQSNYPKDFVVIILDLDSGQQKGVWGGQVPDYDVFSLKVEKGQQS